MTYSKWEAINSSQCERPSQMPCQACGTVMSTRNVVNSDPVIKLVHLFILRYIWFLSLNNATLTNCQLRCKYLTMHVQSRQCGPVLMCHRRHGLIKVNSGYIWGYVMHIHMYTPPSLPQCSVPPEEQWKWFIVIWYEYNTPHVLKYSLIVPGC